MQKPTLLLAIDSLQSGGAEILLVGILRELNKKYDVILVTLSAANDFKEADVFFLKKYVLGYTGKLSLLSCVLKLRKIIKTHEPVLIHAHLFYSSLIARLAAPSSVPLLYTLHNEMSRDIFNNSKISSFAEKHTIKKDHSVMAVTQGVLDDYEKLFGKQRHTFVLKNYIADEYFNSPFERNFSANDDLKLVAVANIKKAKNYGYLVKAFQYLKDLPVSLDIYGRGNEGDIDALQKEIAENKLPVRLKGTSAAIYQQLPMYDMYVSSSLFEGFGLSVIEGMAMGLPVLLSDIAIFHEVTNNNALFFDLSDPRSFADLIKDLFTGKYDPALLSRKGIKIAEKYKKQAYVEGLFKIYGQVISAGKSHN